MMGRPWKEPGLFNCWHEADLELGGRATLQEDGSVDFTFLGGYYGDEIDRAVSLGDLDKLARAARALKEYTEAEVRRVAAASEEP